MSDSQPPIRTWIFDFVTMIAVVIGLIYGGLELRGLRQEQETQAVLELHRIIQTPEHIRAVHWVVNELPDDVPPEDFASRITAEHAQLRLQLELTWESLGIMVFRGDVPLEWVDEFYRFAILTSWRKLEPHIRFQRADTGYDGIAEWFQWLAERLEERTGGGDPTPAYEAHQNWEP